MKAIILAAGEGRRLGIAGPKCMLDVAGTSIIDRQLNAFRANGIDDFVIVVGHARDQIRRHLAERPGKFTFIVNQRYAQTNTVYSLYLARDHIDDTFYYTNADVVFDRRLIQRLRTAPVPTALAVETARCADEEVKVVVRDNKIIRIGKKLDPAKCLGEFVGIAQFAKELTGDFVKALTDIVEDEGAVNEYFEYAVDRLCNNHPLTPIDITDLPCKEIDFPEDLVEVREKIASRLVD